MNERDTFAAAALMGLLCNLEPEGRADMDRLARMAHAQADAMLRERGKQSPIQITEGDSLGNSKDVTTGRPMPNGAPPPLQPKTNHDAAPAARCPCQNWGRDDRCTPTNNGHHPSCSLASFDAWRLVASLVDGIKRWAADEDDTVHPACIAAYLHAKHFLRTHDAAPAATASADSAAVLPLGTGKTDQPFAWYGRASRLDGGHVETISLKIVAVLHEVFADEACPPWQIAPLYLQPQPALTPEEREAVKWAVQLAKYSLGQEERYDALRGLLERLGGGA